MQSKSCRKSLSQRAVTPQYKHILFNKGRHKSVKHCEYKRSDMEAVNIGISTNNYLVPAKVVEIEHRYLLVLARLDLNSAAYDFYKICDYLILEILS